MSWMTGVGSKARSQVGASFLIALAFALICALVAAVVLSASVANTERSAGHIRDEQGYFAVTSALDAGQKLVERDVCQVGFSFPSVPTVANKPTVNAADDPLGLLQWAVDAYWAKHVGTGAEVDAARKYLVVSASDLGEEDVDLNDVLLVFTMKDAEGNIVVQACQNEWDDVADVPDPADVDAMRTALVQDRNGKGISYANVLTKDLTGTVRVQQAGEGTSAWAVVGPEGDGS